MRVLFIGSQPLGKRCLRVLYEQGDTIAGVITFVPDDHEKWGDEVSEFAREIGSPCMITDDINHEDVIDWIEHDVKPEIIYVIGWRQIIKPKILGIPPYGTVGIHFSLLPKFRGHAPVSWAIIAGEEEIGLTFFYFTDRADAGDIIAQKSTPVNPNDNAGTLRAILTDLAVKTIEENAPLLRENKVTKKKQDESQASYGAYKLPEHGEIDWNRTSKEIHNLIRATTRPYPGAFTYFYQQKITIWASELLPAKPTFYGTPGQFILRKKAGLIVKTGDHAILIKEIEPEGKETMIASEYFRSTKEGFD